MRLQEAAARIAQKSEEGRISGVNVTSTGETKGAEATNTYAVETKVRQVAV